MTTSDGGRTVYAVSSGSYSDYSVGVLFTTKEVAETYVENEKKKNAFAYHYYGDDPFVEEFYLFDTLPEEVVVDVPLPNGVVHSQRMLKIAQDEEAMRKAEDEGLT